MAGITLRASVCLSQRINHNGTAAFCYSHGFYPAAAFWSVARLERSMPFFVDVAFGFRGW